MVAAADHIQGNGGRARQADEAGRGGRGATIGRGPADGDVGGVALETGEAVGVGVQGGGPAPEYREAGQCQKVEERPEMVQASPRGPPTENHPFDPKINHPFKYGNICN